jgi:hypothetical protein
MVCDQNSPVQPPTTMPVTPSRDLALDQLAERRLIDAARGVERRCDRRHRALPIHAAAIHALV